MYLIIILTILLKNEYASADLSYKVKNFFSYHKKGEELSKTTDKIPSQGLKNNKPKILSGVKKEQSFYYGENLPAYYKRRVGNTHEDTVNFVILPEKKDSVLLSGLRAGDVLRGEIEQAITASPNVMSPVRVRVTQGELKGSYFLGNGILDKDLQRVLIDLNRLRLKDRDTPYSLKASVLSPNGEVGLHGEFHSKELLFFVGEMLSAGAAGYADATVQRNQNNIGTYQNTPTVDNAAKLGMVNAFSKSADRFAEKQRTNPGYTTTEGFREVKIIITDDPVEINQ